MRLIRPWKTAAAPLLAAVAVLAGFPAAAQRQPEGVIRRDSILVDSLWRGFLYYAPRAPRPGAPLVLVFHGSGGDGARIRGFVGEALERLADERGFFVAYPDGWRGNWNGCRERAGFPANRLAVDDVAFARGLVARLRRRHGVDAGKVRALGYSNGGHMAYRLALETPGEVQAVVALGANLPVARELDCTPAGRPVPVMIVTGTADRINPYGGGEVRPPGGGSLGSVRSAAESAEYFARLAGRGGPPARRTVFAADRGTGTGVERISWAHAGRPEVVLYTVRGGGHTIPGRETALPAFLGPTERRFDAVAEAVLFFDRQPARGGRDPHP